MEEMENLQNMETQMGAEVGGTQDVNFEQSLARLEEIVSMLGSGRAPLAESLALFEEGTGILRFCNGKLEEAEGKVQLLMADAQSKPNYKEFNWEEPTS